MQDCYSKEQEGGCFVLLKAKNTVKSTNKVDFVLLTVF